MENIETLKVELSNCKKEIEELRVRLKSYTNRPSKNKNYYERHKEVLLEKKKKKYGDKLKEELIKE